MRFCKSFVFTWIWLCFSMLASTTAKAQDSKPVYQYMHIAYNDQYIIFAPAFQGNESLKISEIEGVSKDKSRRALESISKILGETSAGGWEVVQVMPVQSAAFSGTGGATSGFTYLLRKPILATK